MNAFSKKLITLLIICCLGICFLASCSGGIDKDEAKSFINNFFEVIVNEDYEKAVEFFHPDRRHELPDIETFFVAIEEKEDIDFQLGISVERYTGFSSAYYDSTVGGSTYEPTIIVKIGDDIVEFVIEIVQNKTGYGIYNLDINT